MTGDELQKAVFAKLSSVSVSVYGDAAPERADFPYVTIGDDTAVDWSDKSTDGTDETITIHTWSRTSRADTKAIGKEIYDLLHNGSLAVSGFTFVSCRFEFSDSIRDPDGKTFHGIQRYRILITE